MQRSGRRVLLVGAVFAVLLLPALSVGPAGAGAGTPTFAILEPPSGWGRGGAEPSVGVNWNTGSIMTISMLRTLRLDLGGASPAWEDVSPLVTGVETLDPILFTDPVTGRTFVSQLAGACSMMAFTDDDGESWTPVAGGPSLQGGWSASTGCSPGAAVDHQTIGGGPFPRGLATEGLVYPHAVYYCAHNGAFGMCGMSMDGGLTFNPASPIETHEPCVSIHGHLKVSPVDGTAYVPIPLCSEGTQVDSALGSPSRTGLTATRNGVAWTPQAVPGTSTSFESDPSVAIGSDGTVYLCYQDEGGRLGVVVSHDEGATWSPSVDPAVPLGVRNVQFPAAVAGDGNRAACAFVGTTSAGDDQLNGFVGAWRLYVAFTYDAGASWDVVDVTGADPVQRGCISLAGVLGDACTQRNLLDFIDAAVTKDGRVVVAYADGCVATCVTGAGRSDAAYLHLAVQDGGKGLFAAYD